MIVPIWKIGKTNDLNGRTMVPGTGLEPVSLSV